MLARKNPILHLGILRMHEQWIPGRVSNRPRNEAIMLNLETRKLTYRRIKIADLGTQCCCILLD